MNIKFELTGVKEARALYDEDKVRRAANQALNRVSKSAMTEASSLIRTEYNISQGRLAQYLRLNVASGYDLRAEIVGRGKGIMLSYFDPKQPGKFIIGVGRGRKRRRYLGSRYGRGYAGDVTALVKRSEGRKVVEGKYENKPFLATTKTGHLGVFVRKGKKRKPIEELFRVGVAWMFGNRRVMEATKNVVNERFGPEFAQQLKWYLNR